MNALKYNITFGTDGFRGVIAKNFTFYEVEVITHAIIYYMLQNKLPNQIAVFYDRRFLSDKFAEFIANLLSTYSINVIMSDRAVPTPALSCFVKQNNIPLGIMITASHNPYEYNGIKIKTNLGMSASQKIINEIQTYINTILQGNELLNNTFNNKGKIEKINPIPLYVDTISKTIDVNKLKNLNQNYLINPMYGSQAGIFKQFIDYNNLNLNIEEIYSEHNPLFPNINPEPIIANLKDMIKLMKQSNEYQVGICFDGDGDRLALIDSNGNFISSHIIFALLLKHLVINKKMIGSVVKTISVSELINKICQKYNLPLYETPIGFKYIAELMIDNNYNILIGGEESGGIGIKYYLPERDGLFLALNILEMIAYEQKPLNLLIEEIYNEFGKINYNRIDIKLKDEKLELIKQKLKNDKISQVNNLKVVKINDLDGIKYFLEDGSWLMFRLSGTEPVLRIYIETFNDEDNLKNNLITQFALKYIET